MLGGAHSGSQFVAVSCRLRWSHVRHISHNYLKPTIFPSGFASNRKKKSWAKFRFMIENCWQSRNDSSFRRRARLFSWEIFYSFWTDAKVLDFNSQFILIWSSAKTTPRTRKMIPPNVRKSRWRKQKEFFYSWEIFDEAHERNKKRNWSTREFKELTINIAIKLLYFRSTTWPFRALPHRAEKSNSWVASLR